MADRMSCLATQLGSLKYDVSRSITFATVSAGVWKGAGLTAAKTDFEFYSESIFSSLTLMRASKSLTDVLTPSRIDVGGQFTANVPDQEYRGRVFAPMNCVTLFITRPLMEATLGVRYSPSMAIENLSQIRSSHIVPSLMQALLEDARSGSPGGALVGEAIVAAIVQLIHPVEIGKMEVRERRHAQISSRLLAAVKELIDTQLADPLHLVDLAEFSGLSIRQFSRSFRASTGLSPHQYIIRARVERARQLLSTTGHSFDEVAWSVGFADRNHMATSFNRVLGISPSHFRHTRPKSRP